MNLLSGDTFNLLFRLSNPISQESFFQVLTTSSWQSLFGLCILTYLLIISLLSLLKTTWKWTLWTAKIGIYICAVLYLLSVILR